MISGIFGVIFAILLHFGSDPAVIRSPAVLSFLANGSLKRHSSMQWSKVTNFNATSKMVYTQFVTFRYGIFYGTPFIQCFSKVFIL